MRDDECFFSPLDEMFLAECLARAHAKRTEDHRSENLAILFRFIIEQQLKRADGTFTNEDAYEVRQFIEGEVSTLKQMHRGSLPSKVQSMTCERRNPVS